MPCLELRQNIIASKKLKISFSRLWMLFGYIKAIKKAIKSFNNFFRGILISTQNQNTYANKVWIVAAYCEHDVGMNY